MSNIPLAYNKFILLLVMLCSSLSVNSNELLSDIFNLVDEGRLLKAETLVTQQLDSQTLSLDEQIYYLAIWGDIYFYRENFLQAKEHYQHALILAKETNNQLQIAEQYKNIAITYSELSLFGASLRWHQLAIEVLNENNWQNNETALTILLAQSSIYGTIGAYEQSMETIAEAQKLAISLDKLDALSDSYVRIATIQHRNNNNLAAINALNLVDTEEMDDRSSLGWYFSLYAEALIALDKPLQAQQMIKNALEFDIQWTNVNLHAFEIIMLESYLKEKNIKQATLSINKFKADAKNFDKSWLLHFLLAKKYKLENNHKLSFDMNLHAISLFFKYSSFNENSNKSFFFKIPQELIEATITDAMDIGLAHSDLIFELYYLAFLAKEPIQIKSLGNAVPTPSNGQNESAVINDILYGEASLNFSDRLQISELQQELTSNEGFVFYLIIGDKLYSLLVTQSNVTSILLVENSTNINQLVVKLLNQLESNNSDWMKTAHSLDNILIKPLRTIGLEQLKTVHFIMDGNLKFLPMDILIDEQGILLSDRHEIAISSVKSLRQYLTSLSATINLNNTNLNLIGITDGKIEIPGYWQTAYRNIDLSVSNLPNVNKELKHLYSKFSNSVLVMGSQATETRAKQIVTQSQGILHFASHGFDNPVAPAYSALVLKSDNRNDGLLQAREISKLSTQAELVVLATCSSAKGGLSGLYGYNSGLAEAFIHAGAKTVIGTLWNVKDQTTYQFMQWFYQGLSQQFTTSKALNYAKQQARQSGWNTYDWAAFILLGQTDLKLNLQTNKSYTWLYFLIIVISILLTVLYLNKYRVSGKV